jgi:uncharacterized Rmd1/YagE family protein
MGDDLMKKPIKIIGGMFHVEQRVVSRLLLTILLCVRTDFIILKDPALKIRLAVSHALAQSTKLSVFEQEIEVRSRLHPCTSVLMAWQG